MTYHFLTRPHDRSHLQHVADDIDHIILGADQANRVRLEEVARGFEEVGADAVWALSGTSKSCRNLVLTRFACLGVVDDVETTANCSDHCERHVQSNVPFALDDPRCAHSVRAHYILTLQHLLNLRVILHGNSSRSARNIRRAVEAIILVIHLAQEFLHRLRSKHREPSVHAIMRELARKVTQKQTTHGTTEASTIGRTVRIGVSPRSKIVGSAVGSEEPVATSESDCVAEDGTTDGVAGAESGTWHDGLCFFCLEPDVQLEVVDVAVHFLGDFVHLGIGVPLLEALKGLQSDVL